MSKKIKTIDRIIDLKNIVRLSSYAMHIGKSRMTIYNMIEDGRLEGIDIDGVQFVVVKK